MAKSKGGSGDFTVTITEIEFSEGPKKYIRVRIDGEQVLIPVSEAVYAYWKEQFLRPSPTPLQRKRFGTFMAVVEAAYKEGQKNGRNAG